MVNVVGDLVRARVVPGQEMPGVLFVYLEGSQWKISMNMMTSASAGGSEGSGKGSICSRAAIPASPVEAAEAIEAAREGAREGTAVGTSSVEPTTTGGFGLEKTGALEPGRFDDSVGAPAERVSGSGPAVTVASRTVVSANASISSLDDCVGLTGIGIATKGSGEARSECAVAKEPGPEDDEEDALEPFLEDLVERAPPRRRLEKATSGESPGNHGL